MLIIIADSMSSSVLTGYLEKPYRTPEYVRHIVCSLPHQKSFTTAHLQYILGPVKSLRHGGCPILFIHRKAYTSFGF